MTGYVYILLCENGQYYTGSTKDLDRRIRQHVAGEGANFTRKHPPVELLYVEEHARIDKAFYREKQIQGWSRKKKEALIEGRLGDLHGLAECKNETNHRLQTLRDLIASHSKGASAAKGTSAALSAQEASEEAQTGTSAALSAQQTATERNTVAERSEVAERSRSHRENEPKSTT